MARLDLARRDEADAGARDLARMVAWRLAPFASIGALLIGWEVFARSGAVTMFMLPPFSVVLERIWTDAVAGDLWINMAVTLYRALAGFLIAAIGGVALGFAMARSRLAHWFFDPIISIGFPMPKIAFLPVIILWLGLYDVSKISMVVLDADLSWWSPARWSASPAWSASCCGRRATWERAHARCCGRSCCRPRCRRS